ncbi:MAG: rhodanese-like domain-containing protein, partial [Muribaculaceae bacterium]|nr:rhodanese-like domain-containing protein [Muribaculaceae bacterium]
MKKLLLIIMTMLGLNSCAAQDAAYIDTDAADFARFIKDGKVQLLDVRTPAEYAEAHIAGARNIDIYDAGFMHDAEEALDKSRPVAVYCRSGKRSADAAARLAAAGYKVTYLEGGILAWTAAGRPVE